MAAAGTPLDMDNDFTPFAAFAFIELDGSINLFDALTVHGLAVLAS